MWFVHDVLCVVAMCARASTMPYYNALMGKTVVNGNKLVAGCLQSCCALMFALFACVSYVELGVVGGGIT